MDVVSVGSFFWCFWGVLEVGFALGYALGYAKSGLKVVL